MATTASRPATKHVQGKSLTSRILYYLLMGMAVLGCLALIVLMFGRCTGEEFSSQDFSRRSFFYFRVPLIKLQITPIIRDPMSSLLVQHLQTKKLIPKGKPNWELARLQAGVDYPYEADELILCRYLDQRDSDYDLRWLTWSKKNPKLARAFWPIVARVAHEDLYLLIPDLFRVARQAKDAVQLDADLRQLLILDTSRIAAGQCALGNHERAAKVAAFALALAGDKETWTDEIANAAQSARETEADSVRQSGKSVVSPRLPDYDPERVYPDDDPAEEHLDAVPVEEQENTSQAVEDGSSGNDV